MTDLASRDCIPCRGGVPPLRRDETEPLLAQLDPAWSLLERDGSRGPVLLLSRRYRFADFAQAMHAANAVAGLAEQQRHHPDLHVAWGCLRVEIWTHKIGGLTESDFIFAAKCDAVVPKSP